jgi:hypothetical protein
MPLLSVCNCSRLAHRKPAPRIPCTYLPNRTAFAFTPTRPSRVLLAPPRARHR